jgi:hypothetical protein
VAVIASNIGVGVPAVGPVTKDSGMLYLVALNTGDSLLGHAAFYPELLRLGLILGVSQSHDAAHQEEASKPYDQSRNSKMPFHFYTPFLLSVLFTSYKPKPR